jgi:uncharacterized protein YbbC (DUF1343 family)
MTIPGLDIFLEAPDVDGPIGLLSNVASQTMDGATSLRALREVGVNVAAIFGPEHGYYGQRAAGEHVDSGMDDETPIYSLYGDNFTPAVDVLSSLSTVIIDLQDVGMRWYTYLTTVRYMLEACRAAQVPALLLDRPNPLGGVIVEGMRATREFYSMVAPAPMPARYGLTIAEAAQWMNTELGINADLDIIPMRDWTREMFFQDTGLFWSSPSPAMATPQTAFLYSGTCMVEGINVSEGRGTALPFRQIGAPFIDAEALSDVLNGLNLPGVAFRPCWFTPTASKYAGEPCQGVRIFLRDPRVFEGYAFGLHLINTLLTLYPDRVKWVQHEDHYFFDYLLGTAYIRKSLERGVPVEDILEVCEDEARAFQAASAPFWLYE